AGVGFGLPHHGRTLAPFAATGEHCEDGERVRFTPDRADKRREGGSEVGVAGGETTEGAELSQVEEIAEQTRVVGREKPTTAVAGERRRRFVEGSLAGEIERRVEELVDDRLGDAHGRAGGRAGEERVREPPERAEGDRGVDVDVEILRDELPRRRLRVHSGE